MESSSGITGTTAGTPPIFPWNKIDGPSVLLSYGPHVRCAEARFRHGGTLPHRHAAASRRGVWLRAVPDPRSDRGPGRGAGSDAAGLALFPCVARRGAPAVAVAHRTQ